MFNLLSIIAVIVLYGSWLIIGLLFFLIYKKYLHKNIIESIWQSLMVGLGVTITQMILVYIAWSLLELEMIRFGLSNLVALNLLLAFVVVSSYFNSLYILKIAKALFSLDDLLDKSPLTVIPLYLMVLVWQILSAVLTVFTWGAGSI